MKAMMMLILAVTLISTVNGFVPKVVQNPLDPLDIIPHQVCCPRIGCFESSFPLVPVPQCPEKMNIDMELFTRKNPKNGQKITRDTIPSAYKIRDMTIFVAHGWLEYGNKTWLLDLKDEALKNGDYNVIIVGWQGGSKNPWYPQSAANTKTVGAEVALVAKNLIEKKGQKREELYCIGHSLGSHVCGNAGNKLKFGRISGVDPAGPLFEDRNPSNGLNRNSADFVDNIHTNGMQKYHLNLGTMRALGHVDFYPNGGASQPGCVLDPFSDPLTLGNLIRMDVDSIRNLEPKLMCSHQRSVALFIQSINNPCFLTSSVCVDQYLMPATCSTSPRALQSMGFRANKYKARGKFFLRTRSYKPFCLGQD